MVASALLRNNVSIEEWLTATTFTLYSERNCSLRLITVTYKLKMFLGTITLIWITAFSYEALPIISLRFLYICQ